MKPDPKGRPVVKIVYTVLESQYQSSLTAAVQAINAGSDQVCYELIGYLLEELRTPENYDNFKQDLEDANVFIGSLIFIEDLAEKVLSSCRLSLIASIHLNVSAPSLPCSTHQHVMNLSPVDLSFFTACMCVSAETRPQHALFECRLSRPWSQTAADWTHVSFSHPCLLSCALISWAHSVCLSLGRARASLVT